jgi:DNA-binding XRE family transcriptional regulator
MAKVAKSTKIIDKPAETRFRATEYEGSAEAMQPATPAESATRKWKGSMRAHFRRRFGKKLQEFREKAGLTRNALGVQAGVAPISIARIESGERSCSFQTAVQLAGALGVEVNVLAPVPPQPGT